MVKIGMISMGTAIDQMWQRRNGIRIEVVEREIGILAS